VILKEGSEEPELLTVEETATLLEELQAEGVEILLGAEQWTDALRERGWLLTEKIDDSFKGLKDNPSLTWAELQRSLNDGNFANVHIAFIGLEEYLPVAPRAARPQRAARSQMPGRPALPQKGGIDIEIELPIIKSIALHVNRGGLVSIESPLKSRLWGQPTLAKFVQSHSLHYSRTDMCCWGMNSKNEIRLCSNIPKAFLGQIEKARCACNGKHSEGFCSGNTRVAVEYTCTFAKTLATVHSRAWINQQSKTPSIKLREMNNRLSGAAKSFGVLDSAADKFLLDVSDTGSFILTEIYGNITCQGFNNEITKLELGRAETVAFTTAGNRVILEAYQAVVHQDEKMHSLYDPSGLAEAGWDVMINFTKSSGNIKFGKHEIKLETYGTGIGFHSQRPTKEDMKELPRLVISTPNYDKKSFLEASSKFQQITINKLEHSKVRTGTQMGKSKYSQQVHRANETRTSKRNS
jgi:hypothetical protein